MPKIIIELTDAQYEKYNEALAIFGEECIAYETMGGITLELSVFSHLWNNLVLKTHHTTELGEVDIKFEP